MRLLFKFLPVVLGYVAIVLLIHRYGTRDVLFVALCFAIMVPILYLVIDRFIQKHNLLRMKEEALRAELSLLKNQINPHFFFNTLNNLYGLTVNQSDLAPRMILELSNLMRFTIYEGRKDHVFLRDEIEYLEHYLAIQRIRIKAQKADISFEKEVEDGLVRVPPLMFIILVENAFKHGIATLTGQAFVRIRLRANLDRVAFHVENNFDPGESRPGGIGQTNLKRRLELLFPGRHQFVIASGDGIYRADLRIDL